MSVKWQTLIEDIETSVILRLKCISWGLKVEMTVVIKVARYESDSFYKIVKNTKLNHVS